MHRNQRGAANAGLIITIVTAIIIAAGAAVYMVSSSGSPGTAPEPGASDTPSAPTSASPSASAEPASEEPSATPSAEPATLAIVSLTPADQSASGCTETVGTVAVTFRWTTTGAAHVWFGVRTDNAKADPYASDLDPAGDITIDYPCGFGSESYTLTIAGADGTLVHRTVTLLN